MQCFMIVSNKAGQVIVSANNEEKAEQKAIEKGKIMNNLTSRQYYTECENTASLVVEQAIEAIQCDNEEVTEESINDKIFDYVLHENIDSHEYVIYNYYHLPILQISPNEDYMIENIGSDCLEYELKNNGLSGLHCALAFWAFYADVSEYLEDEINEQLEKLEEGEE